VLVLVLVGVQFADLGIQPDFRAYVVILEALCRQGPFIENDAMTDGDYISELALVTLDPSRGKRRTAEVNEIIAR
jgi:hypothetical protein